ncbi:winged helix-turn-helix domain-containing protein [Pseudomonas aeruginosa]
MLEAGTGEEGLAQAALNRPDLVVLDLGLPDRDGQDIPSRPARMVAGAGAGAVGARQRGRGRVLALDGGANDYVTKPFGIQEFLARVRVLLRQAAQGESPEASVAVGPLQVGLRLSPSHPGGAEVALTRKEYAVLAALARHLGRVVTQQQLLKDIWGPTHVEDTPLPAGRGRPPAPEARRRSGQPALPGDRGGSSVIACATADAQRNSARGACLPRVHRL